MKIDTLEPAKTSIQVIERMVALLDALANYPDPVSLKELSKVSGLHPSTAHRILNDMVVTRFVDRVEPGTYRLGMRLLELGNVVKSRLSVREAELDSMRLPDSKSPQLGAASVVVVSSAVLAWSSEPLTAALTSVGAAFTLAASPLTARTAGKRCP